MRFLKKTWQIISCNIAKEKRLEALLRKVMI